MHKGNIVCMHNGVLVGYLEGIDLAICSNMGGARGHYAYSIQKGRHHMISFTSGI